MTEKRERRCETCAAWNGSHSVEESGYCQEHSPSGCDTPTFAVTNKNDWCRVDYTPLGLTIGVPDTEDLLLRIQNNYAAIESQRDRMNRLSDMIRRVEVRLDALEEHDVSSCAEASCQTCGHNPVSVTKDPVLCGAGINRTNKRTPCPYFCVR